MKTVWNLLMALAVMTLFSACASKDQLADGFCHGMYDFFNQHQRNMDAEPVPPPGSEPLTYDQYQQARQSK